MSKSADLIKSIAKKPVGEKPTFGTDPREPWSAKYNVNEDAILNKFLKSRGLNPITVTKDQKVAHSKMGEFLKWKRDHMFEQTTEPSPTLRRLKELQKSQKHQTPIVKGVAEAVDKKDAVTFDIPLLIRVLELAREDIKSDMDLHRVVERLINMRDQGMLTMDDYDTIANIKENHIAIAMGRMLDDEGSMVLDQLEQLERAIGMIRAYVGKDYKKQLPAWVQSKVTLGTDYIDTVGNYLSSKNEDVKEEVEQIDELKKSTLASYAKKATDDSSYHSFLAGTRSAKDPERLKDDQKAMKRQSGVNKAIDRLAKEEIEPIDEISKELAHSYFKKRYAQTGATRQDKPKGMPRVKHDKQLMGLHRAQRRLTTTLVLPKGTDPSEGGKYTADSVEVNGTPIQEGSAALRLAQALRKEREARELKDKSRAAAEKNEKAKQPVQQQENTMDPLAATQAPCDCANTPDDVAPKDKNKKLIQMSKSARIIKSIYHRKNMKEETFDTEKEDKSVATYGKKPKITDASKKIEATSGKPQAASIMTGGTTLTGTPRDTVEIDPMMKLKPGLIGQTKK